MDPNQYYYMGFNTGQYRLPSEWDLSQEPADRVTADCHDDLATVLLPYPGLLSETSGAGRGRVQGEFLVDILRGEITGLLTLSHLIDNGGVSQQRQLNQDSVGLVVLHSGYTENVGL